MSKDIEKLIKNSNDPEFIESVFAFAKEAYKDKYRISGENYIDHAIRVAEFLSDMNLDPTTVSFGLLHDIVDDMPPSIVKIELKEIGKRFGKEMAQLIEKISELRKIRYSLSEGIKERKDLNREKIENLRRMFLALSGDLRVVLVELISRLDGLNFLHYMPQDRQKLISLETLQIFEPIASRLGLSKIRRDMEDTAFSYLLPENSIG